MPAAPLPVGIGPRPVPGPDEWSTNVLHFPGPLLCLEAPVSTTTIRIDDDLKARVATAAERAGKTAHGFIVEAIAQATEQSELESDFHQVAARRLAKILATGQGVPLGEARGYLLARAGGKAARRPKPSKLGT